MMFSGFPVRQRAKAALLAIAMCAAGVAALAQSPANAVPEGLATFAAVEAARELFGPMTPFDRVTAFDLDGRPAAYIVTLISENVSPPAPADVEGAISSRHASIKELQKAENTIRSSAVSGKTKAMRLEALHRTLRKLREEMARIDVFATVICGATEDRPPVIRAYRGLPEHLTTAPAIDEALRLAPDTRDYRRTRVLYLSALEQAYLVESAGTSGVTPQARPLQPTARLITLRGRKLASLADARRATVDIAQQRIREEASLTPEQRRNHEQQFRARARDLSVKWQDLKTRFQRSQGR